MRTTGALWRGNGDVVRCYRPARHGRQRQKPLRETINMARERVPRLVLSVLLALTGCGPSGEETAFPNRAIEIVSWATPGGPSDLLARALAEAAPDHFDGQRVSVMTRQGGAGAAGMQYLRGRAGDPHVLGVFTASGTVNMATGRIPFGPGDFTPILRIQVDPFLVAVRKDSPFRTLDDLFEAARRQPGEVSMSGFGAASAHFLGFQRLRAVAGDPELHVSCLIRTAEGKFYRVDVADAQELAGGFPDTREELFAYDGVILGSVEASFFSQGQLNMLRDFVSQRGGGLLTLGGTSAFGEGGYRDTPLAEVLPLTLPEAAASPAGAGEGPVPAAFRELRVLPTRAGSLHPVARLDPDPLANEDRYRNLPPLSGVNRLGRPKPGATVLLEGLGPSEEPEAVLLIQRFGRGRSASLTVQDLWVWQMYASVPLEDETHEVLSRRLLRWLASEAPRRLEVSASPAKSLVGERVTLRARVEDERFLAVNDAFVEAEVTGPDGVISGVPLRWTGQGDGEYSGVYVPGGPGTHQVEVRAGGGGLREGAEAPRAATLFEAGVVDDEFFDAEADPDLLARIAEATGGRLFEPDEAEALLVDLSLAESGTTVVERRELWNVPAVFLLLFGLLAADWGVRHARGLP